MGRIQTLTVPLVSIVVGIPAFRPTYCSGDSPAARVAGTVTAVAFIREMLLVTARGMALETVTMILFRTHNEAYYDKKGK